MKHGITLLLFAGAWLGVGRSAVASLTFETIDENNAGGDNRFALDSVGRVHVSYRYSYPAAPPRIELRYAVREAGTWEIEVLGFQQSCCYYGFGNPRLAVDSSDRPHLAYLSRDENGARHGIVYGYRDKGGWHWETADPDPGAGGDLSIAVDANGDVHLAYQNTVSGGLRYARRHQGSWTLETADPGGGNYSFLDLGPGGWPAISHFLYGPPLTIAYTSRASGVWSSEPAVTDPNLIGCSSLEVDDQGVPHLSYTTSQASTLTYATKIDGVWASQVVPPAIGYLGAETSLELDSNGEPHIVYQDGGPDDLHYAVRVGGTWHVSVVATEGQTGYHHDLKLDELDVAHMTFSQTINNSQDLQYAVGSVVAGAPTFEGATLDGLRLAVVPNPTREEATLRFELIRPSHVRATVYDASGRWIVDLARSGLHPTGTNRLIWDGRNLRGVRVPPGVYFVRLDAGGDRTTRPVVLIE